MDLIGNRPHRVNLDGKSCTEIGISAVALLPGSLVHFDTGTGLLVQNAAKRPATYIVGCADYVGANILTAIPAGDTVTSDYFEEGRVFAALVKAGSVCVAHATLLGLDETAADGSLVVVTDAADAVAQAIEDYTVPASTVGKSHVKVRAV